MTTYVPDPRQYQQLALGGVTGPYDCTGWGAAYRVDAHSKGTIKTTGRTVRLHSDEPKPDPASPGLNLGQADASVIDITSGRVDFDTRVQGRSLSRADVKWRIQDGRFCGLSVKRSVFVNRGFLEGFTGAHDVTLFVRDSDVDRPLLFDPLVRSITAVSWDVCFDAAEALTGGYIYAQFTRDLTPDYHWVLRPDAPATVRVFNQFLVKNGQVVDVRKRKTHGVDVKCTPPRYVAAAPGKPKVWNLYLVQVVGGDWDGWYVNARWAEELNP